MKSIEFSFFLNYYNNQQIVVNLYGSIVMGSYNVLIHAQNVIANVFLLYFLTSMEPDVVTIYSWWVKINCCDLLALGWRKSLPATSCNQYWNCVTHWGQNGQHSANKTFTWIFFQMHQWQNLDLANLHLINFWTIHCFVDNYKIVEQHDSRNNTTESRYTAVKCNTILHAVL